MSLGVLMARTNDQRRSSGQQTRNSLDRVIPHDPDAERAVLGSLLLSGDAFGAVSGVLRGGSAEFFVERHGQLYRVIESLHAAGKPIDGVEIAAAMTRDGAFEAYGGYGALADLVCAVPSHMRAGDYARNVHEQYLRRRAIEDARLTMDLAFDAVPVDELVSVASKSAQSLSELALSRQREDGSLMDAVATAMEAIENPQGRSPAISTGLFALDDMIYGLEASELVMIGARPSGGKTALALGIAESVAIDSQIPSLLFSLEMRPDQIAQRMILSRARVDGHMVRHGRIGSREIESLRAAAADLTAAPLLVHNRTRRLGDIVNVARLAVRERGVRVVMVDYLNRVEVARRNDRYDLVIAEITTTLKAMAEDLGVCCVLLAQLNRKLDSEDRPPRMSDFRDSGAIEQDADKIILPWQDPKSVAPIGTNHDFRRMAEGEVHLVIAKHRNGPTGSVTVNWRPQFARFENQQVDEEAYASTPNLKSWSNVKR